MIESLILFESVINSRWFLRTSIILFLNKIDVFKTKLPKVILFHAVFLFVFDSNCLRVIVMVGATGKVFSRVYRR